MNGKLWDKRWLNMEQTSVRKLARVLRVMVLVVFACNLVALPAVPSLVYWYANQDELEYRLNIGNSLPNLWLHGLSRVWKNSPYTFMLALFLVVCGVCTALILWQGKRVLDTILKGEPFSLDNAANLRRAAACCFLISGMALVRLVWGLADYRDIGPLLSYNALFVPIFLMGGLLFLVMSALFRQAAEIKTENDLTI